MLDFMINAGLIVLILGTSALATKAYAGAMYNRCPECATLNAKSGAKSASGAFTDNYGTKEIAKKLDPYLDALQDKIDQHANVIGVIVATTSMI